MRVWLPTIRAGTGSDVFTERLAAALISRGVEAQITWFHARYELFPEIMRAHPVPAGTSVIHANGWLASPFVGRGVPLVTTVHHLVHDPAYAPYRSASQALYHRLHVRWRELRALRGSDAVTAVTHYVAGTVEAFSGRRDVAAIPNWVDVRRFHPGADDAAPTARSMRLLLVGNRTRRKGFDLLPALAAQLGPGFELRCTGGLRADRREAPPGVCMLGRLAEDDLIREYQQCDAVVSLSRYEGFGYSALEGMACGKPVIAFRTSGIAEVIDDPSTGFLVTCEDVEAFATHCRILASAPSLKSAMGAAGLRRAREVFSENAALDAYIRLYSSLAS